jgi:hypothetical protein
MTEFDEGITIETANRVKDYANRHELTLEGFLQRALEVLEKGEDDLK